MSDSAPEGGDSDREVRAGEYVLGTMPGEQRAAFAREIAADPALAALVRAWEERLAPLDALAPEVTPGPEVWAGIARSLPSRGNAEPAALTPLRRSRARWRAAAVAAMAVAAGLALYVGVQRPWEPGATYLAVIDRGGALPALVVQVDTKAGVVHVRALAAERTPDHSLELWYIAASGGAPQSLGLVDQARTTATLPPAAHGSLSGATLAVSIEPKGGSPTGQPTGQVVYSGKLFQD